MRRITMLKNKYFFQSRSILWIVATFFVLQSNAIAQQTNYSAPELSDDSSRTIVILPDIQSYVKFERNQGILDIMTAWISENITPMQIELVLCTGDLVEQNNTLKGDGVNGNQSSLEQWRAFDRSIARLDHKIPYLLAQGNHDIGYENAENRKTYYDDFITPDRNIQNKKMLREYYYNRAGNPTLANSFFEWTGPGDIPYLFLNLEFAPRDEVLEWATEIISLEKYAEHRVIILTHSYMNAKNERIDSERYPLEDANYGQAIWEKLIYPSHNIVMVIAGHIAAPDDPSGHVAFKMENRADGEKVTQMIFNAQALGGGWHGNGGDGWLRYLEFMPDGKTVKVKTFSPLFALSPSTQNLAWGSGTFEEFTFKLE